MPVLVMGALALVAEWYFIPLFAATAICLAVRLGRTREWRRPPYRLLALFMAVLTFSAGYAAFSNSYVSGVITHYWLRHPSFGEMAYARRLEHRLSIVRRQAHQVA